jgi:hypothetical protein
VVAAWGAEAFMGGEGFCQRAAGETGPFPRPAKHYLAWHTPVQAA